MLSQSGSCQEENQENRSINDSSSYRRKFQYYIYQKSQPFLETMNNFNEEKSGLTDASHKSSPRLTKVGIRKSKNANAKKPQNIQIKNLVIQKQKFEKPSKQSFLKNLIPFFLNEYKKHLLIQELKNALIDEERIIFLQLNSMQKSKEFPHKYSINNMHTLMENKGFTCLFKKFLKGNELETVITNNTQFHKDNIENYKKAKTLMIKELNSKYPFYHFFSQKKNLSHCGFTFFDSPVLSQDQRIKQDKS